MLVLDGPQGIGKSLFVKWLCSGLPQFFVEGSVDTDSKDTFLRLAGKWIWEVGELGSTLRRADREALKNFLTLSEVTIRKPYGRHDVTRPAMASFIGTINNESGILDDPTGSRRFLICHIQRIDWQRYLQIRVNDLWAEAYTAYRAKEPFALTEDERKRAEQNNEAYQVQDPIELVLFDRFKIDPNEVTWWTSTMEITKVCQDAGVKFASSKALQMALAATLKKLGLSARRVMQGSSRVAGYTGIKDKIIP